MAKIKRIHNKLRQDSFLPEELSWENMEEGIISRIDKSDKKDDGVAYYLYLYVLIIAAALIIGGYKIYQSQNPVIVAESNSEKASYHDEQSKLNQADKTTLQRTNSRLNVDQTNTSQYQDKGVVVSNMKQRELIDNESNIDSKKPFTHGSSPTTINLQLEYNKTYNTPIEKTSISSTDVLNAFIGGKDNLPKHAQLDVTPLFYIKSNPLTIEQENISITILPVVIDPIVYKYDKHDFGSAIEISAIGNLIIPNYIGSETATTKNEVDNGVINYGSSINYIKSLNDKWYINTGLSYQVYSTKFDYSNTEVSSLNVNVMSSNIFTNELTQFTQSLSDRGTITRTVLNYNEYNILSIPISINRYWRSKNTIMSIGTGMRYNLAYATEGKTLGQFNLGESELIEFGAQDYYDAGGSFDALLDLSLRYNLTQSFYVGTGLSSAISLSNWTVNSSYTTRPVLLHASIKFGLIFR